MAVIYVFLLSSLGLAITAQAQECTKPVAGPNMFLKDVDPLQQAFTEGTKVSFNCEVGHYAAGGSSTIICTAGKWSPVNLQCDRKNCGPVGEVQNGNVDYPTDTLFGDKAVITCYSGYVLVGRNEIRCGDKGWIDRLPTCHVMTCQPPPPLANGLFSPENEHYQYREVIVYTCQKEFTLNGTKSRTCSDDGTFTSKPPTCVRVNCKEPEIMFASWIRGSRPPYGHRASVTHECKSGYELIGESTSVCEINGEWSPKLPTCKPKNCDKPNERPNMSWKAKDVVSFPDKTSVTFSCDEGYESAGGSAVITCTTGHWSPLALTCKKILKPPTTPSQGGEGAGAGGGAGLGDDEKKPGNNGNTIGIGVGVAVVVVFAAAVVAFGVWHIKNKKGSQKGIAENETTKDAEDSVQLQSSKHSTPVGPSLLDMKTSV